MGASSQLLQASPNASIAEVADCEKDSCGGSATPSEDCGWGDGTIKKPEGCVAGKPKGCTYCAGGCCKWKLPRGSTCGNNNDCQSDYCCNSFKPSVCADQACCQSCDCAGLPDCKR